MGAGVDGGDGVVAGSGDVGAGGFGVGGEVESVGEWADGDACGDLVGGGVEDPDEAAGGADAPDFVAGWVSVDAGEFLADGDAGGGLEFDEVEDGQGAVGGGDVGVEAEAGAEEGWAVLEGEEGEGADGEDQEEGEEAVVAGGGHFLGGSQKSKTVDGIVGRPPHPCKKRKGRPPGFCFGVEEVRGKNKFKVKNPRRKYGVWGTLAFKRSENLSEVEIGKERPRYVNQRRTWATRRGEKIE